MGSHRKNYTVQFKEEAVKHVIKVGLPAASTDLGVDTGSPGRWKREFVSGRLQGKQSSILSDTEKELQKAKKENRHLREINIDRKKIIHLPTPLLKTPTALSCAFGYLLGLRKN